MTTSNTHQTLDAQFDVGSERAAPIHVEGLTKEFETSDGYELVFEDLDLHIEAGSFVSLIGKSGSGKSTFLSILSGFLEPTEGRFWFGEEGSTDIDIGHVFQEPRLLPWEMCVDNIEYVHEHNDNYEEELAKQYLDLVGLSEHYNKYPTQLSGGQQQRVGIARALSIDPEVLLMDEPFSNLDEITAESLRVELMDIWQRVQKTVLFVTHNITEAIQLSDRIVMLGDSEFYHDIEVPFERPRNLESNEFLEFRQRTLEAFHSINED